jgi:hypothetical protein
LVGVGTIGTLPGSFVSSSMIAATGDFASSPTSDSSSSFFFSYGRQKTQIIMIIESHAALNNQP